MAKGRHTVRASFRVLDLALVPSEILICPAGRVANANRNVFFMDEKAARITIRFFVHHGVDIPVDWEHQSEHPDLEKPGGRAPAAGWIRSLKWKPGEGLFGVVDWTPQGAKDVAQRSYRYVSPVLYSRHWDSRVVAIVSVGLTNNPAIHGIRPLTNKRRYLTEKLGMDLKAQLTVLLGLPEDASDEMVVKTVQDMIEADVPEGAGEPQGTAKSSSRFVRREEFDTISKRAGDAERELRTVKCRAFIEEGMNAGKITQHKIPWWESFFARDPAAADEFIKEAPVVAPLPGRIVQNSQGVVKGAYAGERGTVISSAQIYFRSHRDALGKFTDERSYIDGQLVQSSLQRLSEDEVSKLGLQTVK